MTEVFDRWPVLNNLLGTVRKPYDVQPNLSFIFIHSMTYHM